MKTVRLTNLQPNGTTIITVLNETHFAQEDTVYIIAGNFSLESIIMLPKNCEIIFDGGSIEVPMSGKVPTSGFCFKKPVLKFKDNQFVGKSTDVNYPDFIIAGPYMGRMFTVFNPPKIILTDGCRLKSSYVVVSGEEVFSYEMRLTCDCRITLPCNTNTGSLHLTSNKECNIQIDGKTDISMCADNCKLERIFACTDGWSITNRTKNSTMYNVFTNCEIYAEDCSTAKTSNFLTLDAGRSNSNDNPGNFKCTETNNWLVMRDCVIENMGLTGTVHVDHCTFLFGKNVSNNVEAIHCGDHSRILNSLFDGREDIVSTPLDSDVIDVYNSHDIVIDGCTFIAYKADGEAGRNMITVKSHYYGQLPDNTDPTEASNFVGPQNGVVIRNCYFDLPNFIGSAIEVWNGLINKPAVENRLLNRQGTLIEGNYINTPKSASFVNCFSFSDYLTIRNNFGQVGNIFVLVNDLTPEVEGSRLFNLVHDLTIEGNTLRYQTTDNNAISKGMIILRGTHINNLELLNNKVVGYLWSGLDNSNVKFLTGTIRIFNNETTGPRGLFPDYGSTKVDVMPSSINVFFSGNVSKGVKTDVGSMAVANDSTAGLKFVGRQFYCTTAPHANKLMVFNGSSWQEV